MGEECLSGQAGCECEEQSELPASAGWGRGLAEAASRSRRGRDWGRAAAGDSQHGSADSANFLDTCGGPGSYYRGKN